MPLLSRKELDAKKQGINNLYGKLSEVESTLKEEKKINARLRSDVTSKIGELTKIEETIVSEQEGYNWKKANFITRTETALEERETRLQELLKLRDAINLELADHDLLEAENYRLHKRLKILANQHFQMKQEHKEEWELRKQQCFDVRASMEQIFRHTIKEVDHEYRDRANDKMNKEAEWAREENLRLRKEAGKRQDDCRDLVERQKESYDELVRAKVQRDVIESSALSQEESSRLLARQMDALLVDIKKMEVTKENLEADIMMVSQKLDRKVHLTKEYRQFKQHLDAAKILTEGIKNKVIEEVDVAVQKGIAVVEKNNARKAKELAKSFQQSLGVEGNSSPTHGSQNSVHEQSSQKESVADSEDDSIADSEHGGSLASNHSTVSKGGHGTNCILDPEMVWNSKKSDCHKATLVRRQIRKNRELTAELLA